MTDPTSPRRPTRRMHRHIPIDALDPLPQHLLQSSRQLCEQALVTFTEGDWSAFYLNAGFSLEHALKAVLAAVHPTLIADPRDFDSMHMLARGPINLPHVAPSLRTVAFQQSVSNAAKVAPNLAKLESDIRALARHRNAVAHVGATTSSTTDRDVKTFLTAVLTVVVHLEVDVAEFFGEFTGFMQTQLDEQAADEQREVKALIATAQVHRDRQYTEGFPSQHYGASIHSAEWARGDEFQPFECPVCRIDAVMEGTLAVDVEVDVEMVDGEYVPTYDGAFVVFRPHTFSCRACGLVLADRHLDAAELDDDRLVNGWFLDDVDPRSVDDGMPIDGHEFHDYGDEPY